MSFDMKIDRNNRRRQRRSTVSGFIRFGIEVCIVIALAWLITAYTLEITNMTDASMESTLMQGDTILINKTAYYQLSPARFDIIVYNKTGKEHSYYGVSRVIGLPGETVTIREGRVYIDGVLLSEPMIVDTTTVEGLAADGVKLEENEYFILGDNRNNSSDSRFANIGNVVSDEIVGQAWIRTNKFGIISQMNLKQSTEGK